MVCDVELGWGGGEDVFGVVEREIVPGDDRETVVGRQTIGKKIEEGVGDNDDAGGGRRVEF